MVENCFCTFIKVRQIMSSVMILTSFAVVGCPDSKHKPTEDAKERSYNNMPAINGHMLTARKLNA